MSKNADKNDIKNQNIKNNDKEKIINENKSTAKIIKVKDDGNDGNNDNNNNNNKDNDNNDDHSDGIIDMYIVDSKNKGGKTNANNIQSKNVEEKIINKKIPVIAKSDMNKNQNGSKIKDIKSNGKKTDVLRDKDGDRDSKRGE